MMNAFQFSLLRNLIIVRSLLTSQKQENISILQTTSSQCILMADSILVEFRCFWKGS